MSESKRRAKEIEALKASPPKMMGILAYFHHSAQTEMVALEADVSDKVVERAKKLISKNEALDAVTHGPWFHNPPVDAVIAHVLQTNTFASAKMVYKDLGKVGMVVNYYAEGFYEGAPISCREMMIVPRETWNELKEEAAHDLASTNDIRRYA